MSATPPRASERRALHERTPSEQNRLQVRLVPYTPPRLSFDGSLPTLSRSASGVHRPTSPSDPASPDSPSGVKSIDKGKDKARPSHHRGQTREPSHLGISRPSTFSDCNVNLQPQQQSPEPTSFRRRSKFISLYSDKKFSPLPHSCSTSSATYSSKSARRSSTVPSSSRDPSASIVLVDDRCSSPLSPLHEEFSPTPASGRSTCASPSSWNYRFVGGLRKGHRRAPGASQTASASVASPTSRPNVSPLCARDSFQSARSGSTQSERSNYKIYANSSPAPGAAASGTLEESFCTDPEGVYTPNSSHANVVVLGDTSSSQSVDDQAGESEANYHVASGDLAPRLKLRSGFSRESLLVSPLQPSQRNSAEQPGVLKSCSRGSSHASSLSSVSSIVIEETFTSLLAGAAPTCMAGESSGDDSSHRPANSGSSNARWALFRRPQWDPALSTVTSDSAGVSKGRSHTLSSVPGSNGRGGQGQVVAANAVGDYPACPSPVHRRLSNREQHRNTIRLIRNQDEHGDGLTDLEAPHHHPSRSRMHSLLSSYSSDRNLRSSSSSRSSSLSRSSVPAWARLYYGSGERRWLAAKLSTESMFSEFTGDSRGSTFPSRSPSADLFPAVIQSPRRRPREPASPARRSGTTSDGDNTDTAPYTTTPLASRLRTQTSSIWSPHLRRDRRAIGYGIWEPPSAVWSTNRVWLSRQNLQPILFVVGFVFPLAWAIASFLPLPPISGPEMAQMNPSMSHLDLRLEANSPMDMLDMRLYNHARWWRTLNRAMGIVGIFVIGAIIALIVFGVRQQWRY
ncbi:serine-rich protein [Hirsutella rhossiliensis]|uniref:Serine-rich protein n=1 Tax=Hirsutella rhossiliensis TaxID=111463 RepID=A0A9P8MTT2_9HYPO|nr:serine-rich protein [Hirsutella rhossiliensis]KAH0960071.1 serine-rich protein [Hirsutella rhossiliensis]